MVLAAKIFEIKEDVDLNAIAQKLKDFRREEPYQGKKGETKLVTEISDLKLEESSISGIFSKDFVRKRYYRRESDEYLVTEEATFRINRLKGRIFLVVLAPSGASAVKKLLTDYIANELSEALFAKLGGIVELRLTHGTLKELHEYNPQATKLIWFDDIDIPGVGKLSLAGPSVANTKLYKDYLEHGKIWYVVFEVQKRGITVGIARNFVVTLFSKGTLDEFINYISEDLLTLTE